MSTEKTSEQAGQQIEPKNPSTIYEKANAGGVSKKYGNGEQHIFPKVISRWSKSKDLRFELILILIAATIGLVGALSFLAMRYSGIIGTEQDLRKQRTYALYDQQYHVLQEFASGIPKNQLFLSDIVLFNFFLYSNRRDARYFDGRTYLEISRDMSNLTQKWVTECPHYYSLCYSVQSAFPVGAHDPEEIQHACSRIQIYSNTLIKLFDLYNEIPVLTREEIQSDNTVKASTKNVDKLKNILISDLNTVPWADAEKNKIKREYAYSEFLLNDPSRTAQNIQSNVQSYVKSHPDKKTIKSAEILQSLKTEIENQINARYEVILKDMELVIQSRSSQ